MQNLPGTSTLSQKLLLNIVSIDIIPLTLSSLMGFAIVGGKVEISATGPISLSNWNSWSGSVPTTLLGTAGLNPKEPISASAFVPDSVCVAVVTSLLLCWGAGGSRTVMRALSKLLYRAGVWCGSAATLSRVSATSLTSENVFCSLSRYGWNSGRTS